MTKRNPLLLLPVLAVLAVQACVSPAEPPRDIVPDPFVTACGSTELQGLVGQSASVLETMRFGVVTRVIRPGTAVTRDLLPTRLNIEVDAAEVIVRVRCG